MLGYFFVRRQLRQQFPLLPVDLLRIPIFSMSIGTSICSFTGQMLAMISLPFFLQGTLGRSDVTTGLLLTPWPLATMIMAPLAGRLVERIHAGINLVPNNSTPTCLYLATGFAVVAAVVSSLRISQPRPLKGFK